MEFACFVLLLDREAALKINPGEFNKMGFTNPVVLCLRSNSKIKITVSDNHAMPCSDPHSYEPFRSRPNLQREFHQKFQQKLKLSQTQL